MVIKNRKLQKDLSSFLSNHYSFEEIKCKYKGLVCLKGKLDVVDDNDDYWGSFDIEIYINETEYPNTVPLVIEVSELIDRTDDNHIAQDGNCCLDIPHKLIILKRRGIELRLFFEETIYPYFANYHYKQNSGEYANGEYKHHFKGIKQFYEEEHQLVDENQIIAILEYAIGFTKHQRNQKCSICGSPKFKKCCGRKAVDLKIYGIECLKRDLELFKANLPTIPKTSSSVPSPPPLNLPQN